MYKRVKGGGPLQDTDEWKRYQEAKPVLASAAKEQENAIQKVDEIQKKLQSKASGLAALTNTAYIKNNESKLYTNILSKVKGRSNEKEIMKNVAEIVTLDREYLNAKKAKRLAIDAYTSAEAEFSETQKELEAKEKELKSAVEGGRHTRRHRKQRTRRTRK
jgi:predicted nucleic-acid-binding protein